MRSRTQSFQHRGKFSQRHTEPAHACVHFQMHRMPHCAGSRGLLQRLDVPRFPHRGSEPQADDLALFTSPEPRHEQDSRLNACLAQWDRLIERRDAQPGCAFGLQSARAFHSAVAVSIGLHYCAHGHSRARMLHHRAEVLPQSGQRDFRPCRAGRHSAQKFLQLTPRARL